MYRTISIPLLGLALFTWGPAAEAPLPTQPILGDSQVAPDLGELAFVWLASPGAVRYRLTLAKSAALDSSAYRVTTTDTTILVIPNKTHIPWDWGIDYFWTVTAVFPDSSEAASPLQRFKTRPFDTRAPQVWAVNDRQSLPIHFDLEWHSLPTGSNSTVIEWSTSSDFQPLLGSAIVPASTLGHSFSLSPLKRYYVRLYAGNRSASGDWNWVTGPTWTLSFSTGPAVTEPPSLMSQEKDMILRSGKVTLITSRPKGADSCVIQLSRDTSFTTIASQASAPVRFQSAEAFSIGPMVDTLSVSVPAEPEVRYYWRAAAIQAETQTLWSAPAYFVAEDPDFPPGQPPVLSAPVDQQVFTSAPITLAWKSNPYVKAYRLQLRRTDVPALLKDDSSFVPNFTGDSLVKVNLDSFPSGAYVWTVWGRDTFGWGPAASRVFYVESPPSGPHAHDRLFRFRKGGKWVYEERTFKSRFNFEGSRLPGWTDFTAIKTFHQLYVSDIEVAGESLFVRLDVVQQKFSDKVRFVGDQMDWKWPNGSPSFRLDTIVNASHLYLCVGNQVFLQFVSGSSNSWRTVIVDPDSSQVFDPPSLIDLFMSRQLLYRNGITIKKVEYKDRILNHFSRLGFFPKFTGWHSGTLIGLEEFGPTHWQWKTGGGSGLTGRWNAASDTYLLSVDDIPFDSTLIKPHVESVVPVRISAPRATASGSLLNHSLEGALENFPNWIEAVLYDLSGKKVMQLSPGRTANAWHIKKGMYFLRVRTPTGNQSFRILSTNSSR
jgi:hypothetical protein